MPRNGKKRNQQQRSRQPPAKRQKRAHRDAVPNETSMDVTKITDVNYDCLEKIFDRLCFHDLFNVALSNKTLQVAAVPAFRRKYGIKKFELDPSDHNPTSVRKDVIRIGGLKSCLQFVRCFGEIVMDLDVWNGRNDHLNQYIQQYCAKTLTKFSFTGGSLHTNSFQKPFNKVDVVNMYDVKLCKTLPRFVKWFPNMTHLIYSADNDFHDKRFIPATFPQLQHLTIASKHQVKYAELMRVNPQLQTIKLAEKQMAMKRSLDIIENNGSILKLEISHYGDQSVCIYPKDAKQLVREHPLLVEVDLPLHKFKANAAMIVIRQLNALKMFRFEINDQSECDDIVKQLDGGWHHDIQQEHFPFVNISHLVLKLSR